MKILIQEMIRGHIEVVKKEYIVDIIKELVDREIPFKIDYSYEEEPIFDTLTQVKNKVVSTAKPRASKII